MLKPLARTHFPLSMISFTKAIELFILIYSRRVLLPILGRFGNVALSVC